MADRKSKTLRMMVDTEDPLFLGMKKLKLQGKDLSSVPPELFNLLDLEVLDMSPEREAGLYYKLQEIPLSVGKLVNLKILMLDTNDLRHVPKEIGMLINLERIALSNNSLSALPNEFRNLRKLRSLHLANNKFEIFPQIACEILSLEFFDASDNMLRTIPKSIRNLKNLETLMLYENQIESLPDELCELIQLRCIWLGNNKLTQLPKHFGRLKLLDWSWHYTSTTLDGNNLQHPPLAICKKGADEIEKYFKQMYGSSVVEVPVGSQGTSNTLNFDVNAMRYLRRGSSSGPPPEMVASGGLHSPFH